MKFITRIPTHDNAGVAFDQELLDTVVLDVAIRFGGFTLSDPSRGGWIDPQSGQLYDEPARTLEVVCERSDYNDAYAIVKALGRQLSQEAMYFEIQHFDGVEFIDCR